MWRYELQRLQIVAKKEYEKSREHSGASMWNHLTASPAPVHHPDSQ